MPGIVGIGLAEWFPVQESPTICIGPGIGGTIVIFERTNIPLLSLRGFVDVSNNTPVIGPAQMNGFLKAVIIPQNTDLIQCRLASD